jgi:glycogen operon protein
MVMFNMYWEDQHFQLAPPIDGTDWYVLINTAMPSGADAFQPLDAPQVNRSSFVAGPRSVVVLISGSRRH